MAEMKERHQIVVRMEADEVKRVKRFCLDNNLTISDAIRSGLALLMAENSGGKRKEKVNTK